MHVVYLLLFYMQVPNVTDASHCATSLQAPLAVSADAVVVELVGARLSEVAPGATLSAREGMGICEFLVDWYMIAGRFARNIPPFSPPLSHDISWCPKSLLNKNTP